MKIVIDYNTDEPSQELIDAMNRTKQWVINKLTSIQEEMKDSEGILILHTDGSYEVKETRFLLHTKIIDLLNPYF